MSWATDLITHALAIKLLSSRPFSVSSSLQAADMSERTSDDHVFEANTPAHVRYTSHS